MKPASYRNIFLATLAVSLACSVLCAALWSLQWPLIGDASLMHYAVFLMSRGIKPYKQIVDINLPGSYLFEACAMHLFGWGALAWRLYDLCLMALAGGAAILLIWRTSRFAGLFAAALFALIHIQDGVAQLGQRDLVIAVLLLWSYVALFAAQRGRRPGPLIFVFASLLGVSLTIKPSLLLLGVLLICISAPQTRRTGLSSARHFGLGMTGLLLPSLCVAVWLYAQGALMAFMRITTTLIPLHAELGRRSFSYLFAHSTSPIAVICGLWLIFLAVVRPKLSLERLELLVGIGAALISYILQGKGYPYHRYSFLLLLLVLMGIDFVDGLVRSRLSRALSAGVLAYACLLLAPHAVWLSRQFQTATPFESALSNQLQALGPQIAGGGIQCLDTFGGCINTLYDLRLVQSTGYLYDCYLFMPDERSVTARYRAGFWAAYQAARPKVVILTDQFCFGDPAGFQKLERWPELRDELARTYVLHNEWEPAATVRWWARPERPAGYRIYLRRESDAGK